MLTRSNKTQEKSSRAVSNEVHSKQKDHRASIEFEDTRPEALAQRKLQDMANNSPQLDQNRANQEMVNKSIKTNNVVQLVKTVMGQQLSQEESDKEDRRIEQERKDAAKRQKAEEAADPRIKLAIALAERQNLQDRAAQQGEPAVAASKHKIRVQNEQKQQQAVSPFANEAAKKVKLRPEAIAAHEWDPLGKKQLPGLSQEEFQKERTLTTTGDRPSLKEMLAAQAAAQKAAQEKEKPLHK